jgi:hypothetical protein
VPRLVRGCGSAPTARFALYEIAIILPRAFVPGRRAQAFFSFDSDPRTVSSPVQASPVRSVRLCCSKTSYAHVKKCTVRLGDIPPIGGATSPERLVPVYTVFAGQDGAGLRSTRTSKSTARPCFATPACFVSEKIELHSSFASRFGYPAFRLLRSAPAYAAWVYDDLPRRFRRSGAPRHAYEPTGEAFNGARASIARSGSE